jgi:hypothetical protein
MFSIPVAQQFAAPFRFNLFILRDASLRDAPQSLTEKLGE